MLNFSSQSNSGMLSEIVKDLLNLYQISGEEFTASDGSRKARFIYQDEFCE